MATPTYEELNPFDGQDNCLSLACRYDRTYMVRALLAIAGIDVNNVDEYGFSPLHFAATSGRLEVVELIVEANAKLNLRSSEYD